MGDINKLDGGKFFASDIATIAGGATSATSIELPVKNDKTVTIQAKYTGSNAAQGNVEIRFYGHLFGAGTQWDTELFAFLTCSGSGAAQKVKSGIIDVADYDLIRCVVVNQDATNAITAVNVNWGVKRLDRGYFPR